MSKKSPITKFALFIVFAVFLADFISKVLVHKYLEKMSGMSLWYPYNGIGVFKNFLGIEFSITHATNKGAAWGMLASYQNLLLVFRLVVVGIIVNYILFFNKNKKIVIPLCLVAVGAFANILDYFLYGHVIDMFYFTFWGYPYPVFNIADTSIFIGICWLFLSSWKK